MTQKALFCWRGKTSTCAFYAGVDPCGENGEFHSFVFDGPLFDAPIKFKTADKVLREGFYFCDLVPGIAVIKQE